MKRILLVLLMSLPMMPLTAQDQMETAVKNLYASHQQMRLQDFYKSFFQDRFGPEHLITDSASVRHYLDLELQTADTGGLLFEPVGMRHRYVRIYLRAVQDSLLTADELFDAFIGSPQRAAKIQSRYSWPEEWQQLVATVEKLQLPLAELEADKQRIAQMLEKEGNVAVTHSAAYREAYHPHYRIVCKELFEQKFLPRFQQDKVLIVMVDAEVGKEPLKKVLERMQAEVIYDYKNISGMAVRLPDHLSTAYAIGELGKVEGVLAVERDKAVQLD